MQYTFRQNEWIEWDDIINGLKSNQIHEWTRYFSGWIKLISQLNVWMNQIEKAINEEDM